MAGTDDDAWLDQLRDALASTGGDATDADDPFAAQDQPLSAHPAPSAQPSTDAIRGDDPDTELGPALAELTRRIESLEAAVRDLASRTPRTPPPDIIQLEVMVSRTLRAELPALLDQLAAQTSTAPPPARRTPSSGDPDDLGGRIDELEALHHRTLDALAADRRQLVDDAVAQIRALLFGS